MVGLINDSEEKVFKTQQELAEECIENGIPITGNEDIETLEMYLSASEYDDDDDDFDDDDDLLDDDEDDFVEEDDSSEIEPEDEIFDEDFDFDEDDDDLLDDDDDMQYN